MQAPRSALANLGISNAEIGYIRSRMRLGLALRGLLRGHLRVRKKAKPSRSRGAFLFAPESSAHHFQKRRRQPTFVRCPEQWNGRTHHDRTRRKTLRRVGKGAERAVPTCFSKRVSQTAFSKPRGLRFAQPTLRNARKQKEAERRQTRVSLLHLPAKRAPWPGRARLSAFHCGSRQGDSWSPRLSVRPCFPRRSGAFGPVRPLQPGSGDLALRHA